MKKQLLVSMLLCAGVSFFAQGAANPADDGQPAAKRARHEERQAHYLPMSSLAFFAIDSFYQKNKNISADEFEDNCEALPAEVKEKVIKFKELMDQGKKSDGQVDINQVLQAAIYAGDIDMVNYLIRHKKAGFNALYSDKSNCLQKKELTPLHIAAGAEIRHDKKNDCWDGNAEVVHTILAAAGKHAKYLVKAQDGLDRAPLFNVAGSGNVEVMQALLDAASEDARSLVIAQDVFGRTPLHEAAHLGNVEAVRLILSAAGDDVRSLVQLQSDFGKTPQQEAQGGIISLELFDSYQEAQLQDVENRKYEAIIALMGSYYLER